MTGPRSRTLLPAVVAAALVSALAPVVPVPATAASGPATWRVGAAALTITPPPFNPADDARDFPGCDPAVFTGRRLFDFEEPYVDVAGTHRFDYTRDPYCDANHNGRHDDLYSSGGVDHIIDHVVDDIWARALAIGDGSHTVVIVELSSTGTFNTDIERIRAAVEAAHPSVTAVFAGSTHNESSPDPIGIYGAPADPTGTFGLRSGVDDYYMTYMVGRAAQAAGQAVDAMTDARLLYAETRAGDVRPRLSTNFPTTDDNGVGVALDPKLRVLQAVDRRTGRSIALLLDYAAHNQQTGHADDPTLALGVSDDWPGHFARTVQARLGGVAMFMPADNGSIEDPHMVPDTVCPQEGCASLPAATGTALADDAMAALPSAVEIRPHVMTARRDVFDVPLQNTLFAGAFAAGLFAHRSVTPDPLPGGSPGVAITTEVGLLDLGPQLQMLVEPGEAFPALVEGSPWGIEDAGCPQRPDPAVPAWHAGAEHRLVMGLGDDMVGYLSPAWGWGAAPYVWPGDGCFNNVQTDRDPAGHRHKLEDESVGPTAGNLVADHLAALADAATGVHPAVMPGRFLLAGGGLTRRGADGPVGMWLVPPGSTSLAGGLLVAVNGVDAFGSRRVDAHGVFVDFDGVPQASPDLDTRGMLVGGPHAGLYVLDPYPALAGAGPGPARGAATVAARALPGATQAGLPMTAAAGATGAPFGAAVLVVAAARRRRGRRPV